MLLNVTASLKQVTSAVNKPVYLGTVSPKCSQGPGEMALAFISMIYACINYICPLRYLMARYHLGRMRYLGAVCELQRVYVQETGNQTGKCVR